MDQDQCEKLGFFFANFTATGTLIQIRMLIANADPV
jgi:hypothetical protein